MYGDLAGRFSLLEAGAMAHAVESSYLIGLGVCPIGPSTSRPSAPYFIWKMGKSCFTPTSQAAAPVGLQAATDRDEGVI